MRCDFCKDTGEVIVNEHLGTIQFDSCPYCNQKPKEEEVNIVYLEEDEIDDLIF